MTALVLGSNGQDGTFLTRHLLARGERVLGIGREAQSLHATDAPSFEYRQLDLRDNARFAALLDEIAPQRIFHVAAVHASASHNQYEPVFDAMLDVNVKTVHTLLEHLRTTTSGGRLLYASSAKVFGTPLPEVIDEQTPKVDGCLYAITKNAAGSLIRHYREAHGVSASQLFLFNHESHLRPPEFFIPKLVRCLAGEPMEFATLSFHCDWGSADEYMSIAVEALERAPGEDFALATGRCVFARDLVRALFDRHGVDHHKVVERSKEGSTRPYRVDTQKLERLVGRVPRVPIDDVIAGMLAEQGR